MIFTNAISLVLALAPATLFAAPTKTYRSLADLVVARDNLPPISPAVLAAITDGSCDLSQASMPVAPTPWVGPSPTLKLSHVAIGRGTQNYTCTSSSPSETPVAVGANATLFNATCSAVRAPAILANVTTLALSYAIPDSAIADHLVSGHHHFNASGVPFFDLDTTNANYGQVFAKKNATSDAPASAAKGANGMGSVAWLKLNAVAGDYKEVYRVNTAGGNPPKTCEGVTPGPIYVDYAAEYWFYK